MFWYWKKVGERHYFVEANNLELKFLASMPGIASAGRNVSDLEAQVMEKLVPKLEEYLKEKDPKGKLKYAFIGFMGTLYQKRPKKMLEVGGLLVALYSRKPKWIKSEMVIDYDPANYEPVKEAQKTLDGKVVVDRGMDDDDGISP